MDLNAFYPQLYNTVFTPIWDVLAPSNGNPTTVTNSMFKNNFPVNFDFWVFVL